MKRGPFALRRRGGTKHFPMSRDPAADRGSPHHVLYDGRAVRYYQAPSPSVTLSSRTATFSAMASTSPHASKSWPASHSLMSSELGSHSSW